MKDLGEALRESITTTTMSALASESKQVNMCSVFEDGYKEMCEDPVTNASRSFCPT